ncbi:uncharacterized protein LOC132544038 [Ylistrum balloti]|uniref:uncharacterized protein LOC132544038 n=1 Tax=Ylistrum balloti TaxID=509963 RepID=UPI002905DDE2|nr:uncharacterized protein LOC132544038 [Ylistrum balloti]
MTTEAPYDKYVKLAFERVTEALRTRFKESPLQAARDELVLLHKMDEDQLKAYRKKDLNRALCRGKYLNGEIEVVKKRLNDCMLDCPVKAYDQAAGSGKDAETVLGHCMLRCADSQISRFGSMFKRMERAVDDIDSKF